MKAGLRTNIINTSDPVIITGVTSIVRGKVIGVQEATFLYKQYFSFIINTGLDFETSFLQDGENITARIAITHIHME